MAQIDIKEESVIPKAEPDIEMKEDVSEPMNDVAPAASTERSMIAKFTQLWQACYFERRLNKHKVEEIDLAAIVADLIAYFKDSDIDFRRAIPLLQGLHNLFLRKMNYLLKDSESVLSQMKNPIADLIKLEDGEPIK